MLLDVGGGPVNGFLGLIGFPPISVLSNKILATFAIIVADIWQWTSVVFLMLFAALKFIPKEIIQSAEVDGASSWQIFRFIKFPLLSTMSIVVILFRAIETFKLVDVVYIMTGGGPGIGTETLTLYTYITALKRFELGYGSTIAYAVFVFVLIAISLFLYFANRIGSANQT